MATLNQIYKKGRKKRVRKPTTPILQKRPQRRGICVRIYIKKPKKPNSAMRKVAKLRLFSVTDVPYLTALIPGEGHNLQQYAVVLVQGSWVRDLPGVRYSLVRGKFDLKGITGRNSGRSKYGTPKWKRPIRSYLVDKK